MPYDKSLEPRISRKYIDFLSAQKMEDMTRYRLRAGATQGGRQMMILRLSIVTWANMTH